MTPRRLDLVDPRAPLQHIFPHERYPYTLPNRCIEPINPLTVIADQNPALAAKVMKEKFIADTHAKITSRPAEIFASQGRGMVATTTSRKGFFSDSITTAIDPH